MTQHSWPPAKGRSPRRRIVETYEETKMAGGRPWTYTYERLECGHVLWRGVSSAYQPAKSRACTTCRDEQNTDEGTQP